MKYLYYCLYFCLVLVTYTSSSNAVTNSWCSNGKYSTAISPFPKPQFNKCPGYAKKIMSKKEVREYYINGLGQEYLCKRIKSGELYKQNDRKDYKAIIELIKGKDTKCDQFFKIKLAEKKAEEDKQKGEADVSKGPKEWCIGAGQYGKQYPIKKKRSLSHTSTYRNYF